MSERYTVTLNGPSLSCYDGPAESTIDAIAECVKANQTPPGEYRAMVRGVGRASTRVAAGVVTIHDDRSITIGARWGLPTPVEPIDVSDLGVAAGVPA